MLFLPPGFASEAEVRASPQAQAFLAGSPVPPLTAATPAPASFTPGAPLRIQPLGASGPASSGGSGLRIRPLDDFMLPASAPSSAGGGGGDASGGPGTWRDPRDPVARPMPPEVAAALQGTMWATESGRQRAFWDTGEGASPIGPNTDVIIGTENGQWQTRPHPLFPNGSPAYMALLGELQGEGGRWGASASPRPNAGGISDTFARDPNFQGMSNQDLANQFGHLAGNSALMAALSGAMPGNPFASNQTPADVLSNTFAFAPPPFGTLLSMIAHGGFQAAINQAQREGYTGIRHNEDFGDPNLSLSNFGDTGGNLGFGDPAGEGFSGVYHQGGAVGKGAPKGPERHATLLEEEFVVKRSAAVKNRPLLEAINRGESPKKLRKLIDYLMVEDDAPAR